MRARLRYERLRQNGSSRKSCTRKPGFDIEKRIGLESEDREILARKALSLIETEIDAFTPTIDRPPEKTFWKKKLFVELIQHAIDRVAGSTAPHHTAISTHELAYALKDLADTNRETGDREVALELELLSHQLSMVAGNHLRKSR